MFGAHGILLGRLLLVIGVVLGLRPVYDYRGEWHKTPGEPGIKIRLTKAGLAAVAKTLVEVLGEELGALKIKSYNVPAGHFTVILNNLHLTRSGSPASAASPMPRLSWAQQAESSNPIRSRD